jgi:hypothetical protein
VKTLTGSHCNIETRFCANKKQTTATIVHKTVRMELPACIRAQIPTAPSVDSHVSSVVVSLYIDINSNAIVLINHCQFFITNRKAFEIFCEKLFCSGRLTRTSLVSLSSTGRTSRFKIRSALQRGKTTTKEIPFAY